jgi:hypothetical protein
VDPNIEKGRSQDRGLELYDQLVKVGEGWPDWFSDISTDNICPNDISAK